MDAIFLVIGVVTIVLLVRAYFNWSHQDKSRRYDGIQRDGSNVKQWLTEWDAADRYNEYLRSPYSSNSEIAELAKHFTKEAIRRGIWPDFVVAGLSVGRFLGKTDTEVLSYIDARITEAQLKPKSEIQDGV